MDQSEFLEKRSQFLQELTQNGYSTYLQQNATYMQYQGAGRDMAHALLSYWISGERSIDRFAVQLNGGAGFGLPPDQVSEFIKAMNTGYIDAYVNKDDIEEMYGQLLFWNGCDLPKAQSHFDSVSRRFIKACTTRKDIPAQAAELITMPSAPGMLNTVRKELLSALRAQARGIIATSVSPHERVKVAIRIASNPSGSVIIDKKIMQDITLSAGAAAGANIESYLSLRSTLIALSHDDLGSSPKLLLDQINVLLLEIDKAADFGSKFDSKKILDYWRSISFYGLEWDALERIYINYLQNGADTSMISMDYDVLCDVGASERVLTIVRTGAVIPKERTKAVEAKHQGIEPKMMAYLISAIFVIATIIILISLSLDKGETLVGQPVGGNKNQSKEEQSPEPSPDNTAGSDEKDNSAGEIEATPVPKKTTKPKATPTPTPVPSAEPSPSPSAEPEEDIVLGENEDEVANDDDVPDETSVPINSPEATPTNTPLERTPQPTSTDQTSEPVTIPEIAPVPTVPVPVPTHSPEHVPMPIDGAR